ncbi:MAG: hypothetical protein HF314_01345 [Ignavibacteria bacterium]|jgi:hypothetical protein|nr:hypothetical protein [Ignavibacteria bacterium]MCU7501686.1 hypothetical protein [Ignavibacteria bacterium]MCU7516907.1 hypothetical protein [Ignavibacteria bacterium]
MFRIRFLAALLLTFILSQATFAGNGESAMVQNKIKQYFNNMSVKVKEASSAEEKRDIMNKSFEKFNEAMTRIINMRGIPSSDQKALNALKSSVTDKFNELNGLTGYTAVQDKDLNNFADYVKQDMEQADQWVTISVTTLLLVVILVLLLVR